MPASTTPLPPAWSSPYGSPNTAAPAKPPTSGSRLRKPAAVSAGTRACPAANRVYGASVPSSTRASTAVTSTTAPGPARAGTSRAGEPSCHQASGTPAAAAAVNWAPVTAAGSRPSSRSGWASVKPAESSADRPTSRSPESAPPPPAPA